MNLVCMSQTYLEIVSVKSVINNLHRAKEMLQSQSSSCLPHKHASAQIPTWHLCKMLSVKVHTWNSSVEKVEKGRSRHSSKLEHSRFSEKSCLRKICTEENIDIDFWHA